MSETDPSTRPDSASQAATGILAHARAWLELARLSNAPTVVTNTLAGFVLGTLAVRSASLSPATGPDWSRFALAATAAVLLYTAGMILNDAKDSTRDAETRPTRPIPSRRVCRVRAWVVGGVLLAAGVVPAALISMQATLVAAALATLVVCYTAVHARWAGSCLIMGSCRFLLYILGSVAAAGVATRATLVFGAALGVATVLITLVARAESAREGERDSVWTRPLAWAVVFVPLAAPLLVDPPMIRSTPSLLFAVGFALWGAHAARAAIGGRLHVAIPGWLAGFCLYDAMVLAMHGRTDLALACAGAFVLTVLAQRVLPGT